MPPMPPSANLPADVTTTEDAQTQLDLSPATLTAVLTGEGGYILTLTATTGLLFAASAAGVTVSGSGTGVLTLAGTAADLDAFLNLVGAVSYQGAADIAGDNAAQINLTYDSGFGPAVLGSVNLDITGVNDAPDASGLPFSIVVAEYRSVTLDMSSIVLSDIDTSTAMTVTLTVSSGRLSASDASSVTVTGSGTGTLTLTGTASNLDAFLNLSSSIHYQGGAGDSAGESATLTLTANDGEGSGEVVLGATTLNFTAADIQVNSHTGGDQTQAAATALEGGGFVVVWTSNGEDGEATGVYGRLYGADGQPAGEAFQVNTETAGQQLWPAATALPDGGFVVVWTSHLESDGQDGDRGGIFAQRYDAAGTAVGAEFQVNSFTVENQWMPAITTLADGGFVVVWRAYGQDGDAGGIFGQRYGADGLASGDEFPVNSNTDGDQGGAQVTALPDGGFVVVWMSKDPGTPVPVDDGEGGFYYETPYDPSIQGQVYGADGLAVGSQFQINSNNNDEQSSPSITVLADGGFVVVWESKGQDGSGSAVCGQRYDASGLASGSEFTVNTTTVADQGDPSVTALDDGGFVVTWFSQGQDGDGAGLYGQQYRANGQAVGDEFRINQTTAGNQRGNYESGGSMLITLAGGDVVRVFAGGGPEEVFYRRMELPSGDPQIAGLPSDITVTEDVLSDLDLSGVTLTDADTSGAITVSLTASAGVLNGVDADGVTVTGSGTSVLTLSGTAAEIDAWLNNASAVQYLGLPNANGNNAATVTVRANDGEGSGQVTLGRVNLDIMPVGDAPVLTGLSGLTVQENAVNAAPALIDADVTLTSPSGNFDGGVLVVSGLLAEDVVSLANGDHVSLAAGTVWYDADGAGGSDGVAIGTLTGGAGANLTITFDSDATTEAVEAVIESLTYGNTSQTPTFSRTLNVSLTDGDGNAALTTPGLTQQTGSNNPINGFIGGYTRPLLADMDGDGDLDLVTRAQGGDTRYYENTGSVSAPVFSEQTGSDNPFDAVNGDSWSGQTLGDIDGDGDLDLLIGGYGSLVRFFENTGSASAATFTERFGDDRLVGDLDAINLSLVDIDDDGDLDLVAGLGNGSIQYMENTGSATSALFVTRTGADNPFNGFSAGNRAAPVFGDIDQDGDLDMMLGRYDGKTAYYENTGSSWSPVYVQRTGDANPLNGFDPGFNSVPALADIDNDGDLDIFLGHNEYIKFFENTTGAGLQVQIQVNAESDMPSLSNLTTWISYAEGSVHAAPQVLDADITFTDPDPDPAGAVLTVKGVEAGDVLSLANGETIRLEAGIVYWDADGAGAGLAVAIGAATGGAGSTFTVTFNADATLEALEAVVESLTFSLDSYSPASTRDLVINLADGAGNNLNGAKAWTILSADQDPYAVARSDWAASPELADLDGDGDLDLVVGSFYGAVTYFENTGTNSAPVFVEAAGADNPFSAYNDSFAGSESDYKASPVLADLDGDGDLDMIVGTDLNGIRFLKNIGSSLAPEFEEATGEGNPFSVVTGLYKADPDLVDLDQDGDLDLVVGDRDGLIHYFENTGSATSAAFVERTGANNVFAAITVSSMASVTLADYDDDGDLDLIFGEIDGTVGYAENVGAADAPLFEVRSGDENPFDGLDLDSWTSPEMFDFDGDGDLDLVVGDYSGNVGLIEGDQVGTVVTVNLALEPNGPGLSGVSSDLAVSENDVNAEPVLIDADVTFSDPDGDLDGAILTISGLLPEDRLSLASGAVINLSGGIISYDADGAGAETAVVIGAAVGGSGTPFQITFNSNADLAGVEAVVESLTYANVSNNPTASRELVFSMTDGAGNTMAGATGWAVQGAGLSVVEGATLTPELADLDGDGDLDMIVGGLNGGSIDYYENIGSSSNADFVLRTGLDNPFGSVAEGGDQLPMFTLSDLDGDADLDLVITTLDQGLQLYTNTGSASSPIFVKQLGADNPFSGLEPVFFDSPTLGDLDGDGDQDLIVGSYIFGILRYYENTGSAETPVFEVREGADSPIDGFSAYVFPSFPISLAQPTLADIDQDGDLDLVVGSYLGGFQYFENTGTAEAPLFVERSGEDNPFTAPEGTYLTSPTFGDLDGDGDLELLSGWYGEGLLGARPGSAVTVTITVTAEVEVVSGTSSGELLMGGAEDDVLSGMDGDDRLRGGAGDNTLDGGDGLDTADYTRASAAVTASLAAGTATIGAGTDTLVSIERLIGSRFDDNLTGDSGANRLDGGAGSDRLSGGAGSDIYVVDDAEDEVIEAADGGTDSVYAKVDFTLAAGQSIEVLRANAGSSGLTLTGNDLINLIYGGDGNDRLFGGGGNDRLEGGAGADSLRAARDLTATWWIRPVTRFWNRPDRATTPSMPWSAIPWRPVNRSRP